MNRTVRELVVGARQSVREAMAQIDRGKQKLALVIDEAGHLLGTVSDGDVRRALLGGLTLEADVSSVMNKNPTVGFMTMTRPELLKIMQAKRIAAVPILDGARRVVGIEFLEPPTIDVHFNNTVVLMAGGKGLRLLPLTENLPKPLIRIGNRPILEIIIRRFASQGFRNFVISVNFLGQMIQDHFGDGSQMGVSIKYVEERSSLGTAGSLGLLAKRPDCPILVSNGDLLTKLNYDWMIDFHEKHGAAATVAVREYDMQVPFGVVSTQNGFVTSIDEKPIHRFFVSAGVYVLDPEVLDFVERDKALDMPGLLDRVIRDSRAVAAFPMREHWLDIGRHDDLKRAEDEIRAFDYDIPTADFPA